LPSRFSPCLFDFFNHLRASLFLRLLSLLLFPPHVPGLFPLILEGHCRRPSVCGFFFYSPPSFLRAPPKVGALAEGGTHGCSICGPIGQAHGLLGDRSDFCHILPLHSPPPACFVGNLYEDLERSGAPLFDMPSVPLGMRFRGTRVCLPFRGYAIFTPPGDHVPHAVPALRAVPPPLHFLLPFHPL